MIAQHLQILQVKKIPAKVIKVDYPIVLDLPYAKFLLEIVDDFFSEFSTETLNEILRSFDRIDAHKIDARKTAQDIINEVVAKSVKKTQLRGPEQRLKSYVDNANKAAGRALNRQVRSFFGVDILSADPKLDKTAKLFIGQNTALISDLPRKAASQFSQAVYNAAISGKSAKQLATELQRIKRMTKKRAMFIARDQMAKLYGQLVAERHQTNGITHFTWTSSHDQKVRPLHRQMDGQNYSYRRPPAEGLPGEPVGCRCTATPYLKKLWDKIKDL